MTEDASPNIQRMFSDACRHHQAGRLNEAERLYRQILRRQSTHAYALHFLGVLAHQTGRNDIAADLVAKSIALGPEVPDFRGNFGLILQAQGKLDAAVASYRRAVALKADYGEAYYNLGNALARQGRFEDAASSYGRALRVAPTHADAHYNLGKALHEQGKLSEAAAAYGHALVFKADFTEALGNLGTVLHDQGKFDEAARVYRRALALKPESADVYNNLGLTLRAQDRLDLAIAAYGRALSVKPDHAEAHNNLGIALRCQGKLAEAVAALRRALALRPDFADAQGNIGGALRDHGMLRQAVAACRRALVLKPDSAELNNNCGNALLENGDLADAEASYRRGLALKPDYAEAYSNLGNALKEQRKLAEAEAAYGRALAITPDYAEGNYNLGMLRLLSGRFEEGWPGYEWRCGVPWVTKSRRDFEVPRWQGDNLNGRTVLLHADQGLGDAIQFCRYAPLVAALGGRVLLEVQRPLLRLLAGLPGVGQSVARGDPLPPFDLHCPLMSLPHAFGTRQESIPAQVPYLKAPAERVAGWRDRLGPSGFRIGIVWQGSPGYRSDRQRSMPLACFATLAHVPGVRLISLQKVHGLDQLDRLPEGMAVETLGDDFDEGADAFLDTAAVMMSLDLVVSVDSAAAHLAGALARPVWLPLTAVPHWVWMLGRDDSPWYPTMRLFRQGKPGDWPELFERMADELQGFMRDGSARRR